MIAYRSHIIMNQEAIEGFKIVEQVLEGASFIALGVSVIDTMFQMWLEEDLKIMEYIQEREPVQFIHYNSMVRAQASRLGRTPAHQLFEE